MRQRAVPFSALCVFLFGLGSAVPGTAPEPAGAVPTSLAEAVWRLDRAVGRCESRLEQVAAEGQPLDEDLGGEWRRLRRQLEGLERELAVGEEGSGSALARKLGVLRWRLGPRRFAASDDDLQSLRPRIAGRPYRAEGIPRRVAAAPACGGAVDIGEETVAWRLPPTEGAGPLAMAAGSAWFRFTAPHEGWWVARTAGSRSDTEVAVFASCGEGAPPVAANDDAVGLQSAAGFRAGAKEARWIRVDQRVGRAREAVVLTVESAGGLAGTVTEESTGLPIENVRVSVFERDTGWWAGSGYSDASGTYLVSGLAPGDYVATAGDSPDHLDELWDDRPCPRSVCDVTAGDPIPVDDDAVTMGVDFALLRAGKITGRVRDAATGVALVGARVVLFDGDGWWAGSGYTDSAGRYAVPGLWPGSYFAYSDVDDYRNEVFDDYPCLPDCAPLDGTPIPVTAEQTVSGIDFDLDELGAIAGVVLDARDGTPAGYGYVGFYSSTGDWMGGAWVDEFGAYRKGLQDGTYFVVTQYDWGYRNEVFDDQPCSGPGPGGCDLLAGTPVAVALGSTTGGIDFALDRLGALAGAVEEEPDGEPIAGAWVGAWDASGAWAGDGWTDVFGSFSVEDLYPASYFVTTRLYSTYRNEVFDDVPCTGPGPFDCDPLVGTPVPVTLDSTTAGVDFALDRLGGISGVVLDEATLAPIPSSQVRIWDSAGGSAGYTHTGSDGSYWLPDLYPGIYFLTTRNSTGYLDELYDDLACVGGAPVGCDPTTGKPVEVMLRRYATDIDFRLVRGGAVSGVLFDELTGSGVAAQVDLWDASGVPFGGVTTGPTGQYLLAGLPAGTYFATSRTHGDYVDELFDDLPCPGGGPPGCDPTSGTPIPVALGVTTIGIDFGLVLRGGLGGIVIDSATGLPLPGVAVDVFDGGGDHAAATATDAAGRYQVDLSSGTFYVATDNGRGWVDEVWDGIRCPQGPAILGLCDPLAGDPVLVIGAEPVVTGIDFALEGREIFADGFESGDLSAWSGQSP